MTPDASAIAQTIQLSVTPVFLLVATGSLLNVLAGRLSRVVDRSRVLMARWPEPEGAEHGRVLAEFRAAHRRLRVITNSILAPVAFGTVLFLPVAPLLTPAF